MKKKKQPPAQADQTPPREEALSLMAVQEKLGLFKVRQKRRDDGEAHDFLKKKPLGLI